MGILQKYSAQIQGRADLRRAGVDPFSVRFDAMYSPTEGELNGKRVILLGANNYLGMSFDPECMAAAEAAVRKWGTGTTGSRIANGSFEGHLDLEAALARFYRRKHAMVFTTGYQANLGILSALVGRGDHLILDADSHASIYDGARLGHAEVIRFRHNDPDDLYKRLRRLEGEPGDRLIVVEGIYSMMGDTARLKEIVEVKRKTGAYLLVDEAHSMGVLGDDGRGLAEVEGVEDDVDFVVGTFSKSLGAIGGFCVSNEEDFDVLRVVSRPYMFTASLPPSVIASARKALERTEKDRALRVHLMDNAHRLHGGLRALGFEVGANVSPIIGVVMPDLSTAIAMWNALLEAGVYVNLALPPATPTNHPLLRSSVTAAHSTKQIDEILDIFSWVGQNFGMTPGRVQRALD